MLKAKIVEAKNEGKLEFPVGRVGTKQKTWGSMSETVYFSICHS